MTRKAIAIICCATAAVALGAVLLLVEREAKTAEEQWARAEKLHAKFLKRPDLVEPELKKEQDRVLAAYRAVAEKFPAGPLTPKAHLQAADLLVRWRRLEEAFVAHRDFAEKFKDDPAAPDVLRKTIDLAIQSRKGLPEILKLYRLFVDRYPQDPRAPWALSQIAILMTEAKTFAPDEIRAAWQELLDKYPKSDLRDQAMLGIAEFYKEAKSYEQAVQQLDKVIEEFEGKDSAAKALLEKSRLLAEKMDKKEEAKKTLEMLEEKYPDSEPARRGSGTRQQLEKDLKEEKAGRREEEFQKEHYGLPAGDLFKAIGTPGEYLAAILQQELHLQTVDVEAVIDPGKKSLTASATLTLRNGGAAKSGLLLQLHPAFKVDGASAGGAPAETVQKGTFLRIGLPAAVEKDATVTLKIGYSGSVDDANLPMRIEKTGYAAPGAFWHPLTVYGDLFTGTMKIKLPSGLEVRGTGTAGPVAKAADGWTHAFEAKDPVFGFFFAYANWKTWTDGPVTLSYVTEGFPHSKAYAAAANEILKFYASLWGPLPWTRIDLVESDLPEWVGGISPANLIFLNSKLMGSGAVPESLLAHELAHQWWGNLVPVSIQLQGYSPWLSEGLACYADALFLESKYGKARMEQHLAKAGLIYLERMLDLPDVAISKCWWYHPQYFAVIYMKGGLAFHLLRERMGAPAFGAALRDYAMEYRFKAGGVADFMGLCDKAGGKPTKDLFDQWIAGDGFPHLKIEKVEPGTPVKVTVKQVGTPFSVDLAVAFEGEGKREEKRFVLSKETEVLEAAIPFKLEKVTLDPAGLLLKRPGPSNEWSRKSSE